MPPTHRRSHKKSRKGCTECKRRHIRCDQRQPSCVNCEVAERICSFSLLQTGDKQQRRQSRTTLSPGSEVSSSSNVTPSPASLVQKGDLHTQCANSCCPGLFEIVPAADFTLHHMVLLHHAPTVPNLIGPGRSSIDVAFRHAINAPYLLDEILAFIAFHLAHVYPGSTAHLQRLSTELQTRALASYAHLTEMSPNDDQDSAVPRFLFNSILGRHALADSLTHCQSDFNFFIDRVVAGLELNRGIRAVTPSAKNSLLNSEIRPFLDLILEAEVKVVSPGKECDALSRLMDESDLNEASVKSCRQAIGVLQLSFDLCHHLDENNYPQCVSVFSVKIEAGFVDVLRKHRPEALAILAYFGVLLHRCRTFWAFSDAGAPMIRAISKQLGSYWQEVLAWPLHVLETECNLNQA